MNRFVTRLVFPALIALTPLLSLDAWAQEEEPYEPTPTTLPELIEGVGLEAIDWDVWTVYRQDGEPIVHTRTRAYVEGDVVIFAEYSQVLQSDIYARVCVYSTDGKPLEDRFWDRDKTRRGWAEDGQWGLRSVYRDQSISTFFLNEKGSWEVLSQFTYQPLEGAIHESWIPLAVRYHLERAHERFELEYYLRPFNSGSLRGLRFQQSGVETIDLQGRRTDCVVYEVIEETRHRDPQSEHQEWTSYMTFTTEGHFVREWYTHSPPETDDESRVAPGVIPDGFEECPAMLEGDIGNDVFGEVEVDGDEGQDAEREAE